MDGRMLRGRLEAQHRDLAAQALLHALAHPSRAPIDPLLGSAAPAPALLWGAGAGSLGRCTPSQGLAGGPVQRPYRASRRQGAHHSHTV